MASVDTEIASSSSNIISSTQDSPYQQPTPNGYPTSDHSNRGYNECGQQYFENSVPIISNTKMANGSGLSSSGTAGTPALQSMSRTLRPHSTPATLLWLEDNYELAEGVCIPRSVLYLHYVDFCANNSVQPVNAASFGKIIRQQFPQLTTRRLGTRGQSRYHYYGIAIRESSAYYQTSYSKKSGQNNVDPLKREARENIAKQPVAPVINSRTRTAAMLPQFPNLKDMNLPSNLDKDKISTFLMMYRTHCQRILDTIIRANFDEVQTFLLHFWQGVPPHLSPVLECNSFVNLIGVCDSILYKTIANVLLPSVLQSLPESLIKMMRQFANDLESWLRMSLFNLPETLRSVKLELARRFGQVLRRQTSLNHLSQASRMVVNNNEITVQMLRDWRLIDVHNICTEILADCLTTNRSNYSNGSSSSSSIVNGSMADVRNTASVKLIIHFCEQFERLMEQEAQIESYLEWLESLVHKCVLFAGLKSNSCSTIRRHSRHFLLLWSAFGSRVIRDMTLHSAQSFGSFHLLRLMFDDYVLYLIEYVQLDEQMKQFLKLIQTNEPPVFTFFYFNDCEINPIAQPLPIAVDQSATAIDYESTVSSSTGDHFGPTDNSSDCIAVNGSNGETDVVLHQNLYCYPNPNQNAFHYQNPSQHIEQKSGTWYSTVSGQHFMAYDFDDQHSNGQQLCGEDMVHAVNGYSVDTTSLVGFNGNDYERQT